MNDHSTPRPPVENLRKLALRDLRFASTVAAGLIAGVLGVGALAAPLVGWSDWPTLARAQRRRLADGGSPRRAVLPRFAHRLPRLARSDAPGLPGVTALPGTGLVAATGTGTDPITPADLRTGGTPGGPAPTPAPARGRRRLARRRRRHAAPTATSAAATASPATPTPTATASRTPTSPQNGLNPNANDAEADDDGDGVSNILEFRLRSAANNSDTNGDGTRRRRRRPRRRRRAHRRRDRHGHRPDRGADTPSRRSSSRRPSRRPADPCPSRRPSPPRSSPPPLPIRRPPTDPVDPGRGRRPGAGGDPDAGRARRPRR